MTLILSFLITSLFSQDQDKVNEFNGLNYGVSGKLNIEFCYKFNPSFKFSVAGGLGYNIDEINFFPTVHTGIILFNKGEIGSTQLKKWNKIQSHFFYSLIGTVKLDDRDLGYKIRSLPFYHFSDFSATPLQNPYKSSISYGRIWVRMPKNVRQKVGIFNANIFEMAQITYYNDGGPILKCAGDKHDRFYTGGILFSYHGDYTNEINLIELSYHKFTGYVPFAFDIGDKLQIDYLAYGDKSQFSYNQQRWRLNISNINMGLGANISLYNFNRLDLQDFLHFNSNVPYHSDYYKGWRLMLGARYDVNYLNISK